MYFVYIFHYFRDVCVTVATEMLFCGIHHTWPVYNVSVLILCRCLPPPFSASLLSSPPFLLPASSLPPPCLSHTYTHTHTHTHVQNIQYCRASGWLHSVGEPVLSPLCQFPALWGELSTALCCYDICCLQCYKSHSQYSIHLATSLIPNTQSSLLYKGC